MKIKTQFVCQNCSYSSPKWLGRCPGCESWNSLVEEKAQPAQKQGSIASLREDLQNEFKTRGVQPLDLSEEEIVELEKQANSNPRFKRLSTGIKELDRVLGGGLVPDSFVLIGGDPGIGKSTLLLQMAKGLSRSAKILYVSGEESTDQIRSRAHRLGVQGPDRIFLASETQLEATIEMIREIKPQVVIIDSIQTFATSHLESAPGSVSQVREVAARLMGLAKSAGIAIFIVGHVTKEGSIAGPKVVEHLVDTVLYFEGDGGASYRLLRAVKNRFGSSRELGVFEMSADGLEEVTNPSSLFLTDRDQPLAGTSIATSLEGTRPLLVEMQALVSPSALAMPRRTSVGLDAARLSILSAILEKHLSVTLSNHDLFFNVAGGLRLSEPACDLAAAAAIWSSQQDRPLPTHWVWIGELGLTGEVRRVSQPEVRIEEAKKLGFKVAVLPKLNLERCRGIEGIRLIPIHAVRELKDILKNG